MLIRTTRVPRALISRATNVRSIELVAKRSFIKPSAALQDDLIQSLYIRELRAYKPPPTSMNDSKGHVQTFSPPKPPAKPEETEIMNELSAYEASSVEIEGQAEAGSVAKDDDWFEEEPDEKENTHH
ncbi:putative atp synthase h mitochondrial precursor [Golovinomyces cichoracearum]|uniref:Putative atp synthase h mitochondrial n=1 Tax=Golovinomyces cichoracearum TaxID=62708 RepID=A0A420IDH1_9PEZI|nr:putative atp synthase h mitochondrial precursor [Golovinomyces cichoracearum]